MKQERTLSFKLSKKLSNADVAGIAAAGSTTQYTREMTYAPEPDVCFDVNYDQ